MEEALEAAATVINYIGEVVINSKCDELSALVKGVEEAAEAAGLQHEELSRLGEELKQASERDRMATVVNLGDASAAMERTACAAVLALRDSAASLARECRDFQKVYQSIENLRRAKAQQEQHRAARPPRSGWLSILGRRFGTQQGIRESLLTDVEKGRHSKDLEDSLAVTTDLLLTEGMLKEKSVKLVDLAHNITITANGAGVPYLCVELLRAMDVMKQADEAHTISSVVDLEASATAMESAVNTLPNILRDKTAELVHACVELKRAHDAMVIVQQAAAKQRDARQAAAKQRDAPITGAIVAHREGGVAELVTASGLGEQPDPGQGESKRSAITAYALYGSVTLITYLGPDKVVKRMSELSQCHRKAFHIAFSLWWTLQAAGAPLSAYARSLVELRFAQVLCRLGVLGINLLVIVFLFLALDIDSPWILRCLVGGASLLHLFSFGLVCWRGDLSQ